MKVEIGNQEFEVSANTAEPVIVVGSEEQGERNSLGITHIDVVDWQGIIARFWVDVRVHRGRPEIIVRTKVGKDRQIQRKSRVQGTFNLI